MTKAWHLRQDGKSFPVKVHIYCMEDSDLSSEAEAAAFIINTKSKDQELAESILDAWMAILIEEDMQYDANEDTISSMIKEKISTLPYRFQYPLPPDTLISIHQKLKNYTDVDTYYEYLDNVRDNLETLQESIRKSFDQQFCRVRYGGQYNSVSGNNEIWFRISSVEYNWANTIYEFVSSIKRSYQLSSITICRDAESDGSDVEYFYKAKDGATYQHMPIEEYYEEEHEHNPVFESTDLNEGVIRTIRKSLRNGNTYLEIMVRLSNEGIDYPRDEWKSFVRKEQSKCVSAPIVNRR